MVRDVVYGSVGLKERKSMHARLAEIISLQRGTSKEDHCELLAYHYAASEQADKATDFAEMSGDRALAASALDGPRSSTWPPSQCAGLLALTADSYRRRISIVQRLAFACVFDPSPEPLEVLQRRGEPRGGAE